jgi:opine dehydrogenase
MPSSSNRLARIAVLGAGSGGQAIAGVLALAGHRVRLWNRTPGRISPFAQSRRLSITGQISGTARLEEITTDMARAVADAEIIIITVTADAHFEISTQLGSLLKSGQLVLLSPGRTGGCLVFRRGLNQIKSRADILLAEAQTLIFACRAACDGQVNIIGTKDIVPVAALPASRTPEVLERVSPLFSGFRAAAHVLQTGLENIGAVFHPAILTFNAAAVERGNSFFFYRDMTPKIAAFLDKLDQERMQLGKAYGLNLISILDWITITYPNSRGRTLCDRFQLNPAYANILAPTALNSRLLSEDIPTGLVPFVSLGKAAGLDMPLTRSLIQIGGALLEYSFWDSGRTLSRMGLAGLSTEGIVKAVL